MQRNLKFWWVVFGLVLTLPSIASALTVEPVVTASTAPAVNTEADTAGLFAGQAAVVRAKSGKACNYPDDCLPSTCVFTPSWRLHQIWIPDAGQNGNYALRVSVEVVGCGFSDLALSASGLDSPTVRFEGTTITVDSILGSPTCPGSIRETYVATARQGNTIVGIQTFSVDVDELCQSLAAPCVFTPHHEFIREVSPGTPGGSPPEIEMDIYVTVSDCEAVRLYSFFGDLGQFGEVETAGPTLQIGLPPVFVCPLQPIGFGVWIWAYDQHGDQIGFSTMSVLLEVAPYCPTEEEWYR